VISASNPSEIRSCTNVSFWYARRIDSSDVKPSRSSVFASVNRAIGPNDVSLRAILAYAGILTR